jgi:thiol-disulfide isomerase/thioredoxin
MLKKARIIVISGILIAAFSSCQTSGSKDLLPPPVEVVSAEGISLPVYDFNALRPLFEEPDNASTYIVNFWASWCKPCIEEMPYFEKAGEEYRDHGVESRLVSLDMESQVESKLIPYLKKNSIQNRVVLLSDPDANSWIPQVDESWTGAIPATLIFNNKKREFFEKPFTYEELETLIKSYI